MHWKCLLGFHKWKRVEEPLTEKLNKEANASKVVLFLPLATILDGLEKHLHKCERCGKEKKF